MPSVKLRASVILGAFEEAQSELVGKAVVLTDGKAGTVENVWLDEFHGLRISIGDTMESGLSPPSNLRRARRFARTIFPAAKSGGSIPLRQAHHDETRLRSRCRRAFYLRQCQLGARGIVYRVEKMAAEIAKLRCLDAWLAGRSGYGRRGAQAPRRRRYCAFGPTLAAEKLAELHGIHLARETVRQWMITAGVWKDRRSGSSIFSPLARVSPSRDSPLGRARGIHLGLLRTSVGTRGKTCSDRSIPKDM